MDYEPIPEEGNQITSARAAFEKMLADPGNKLDKTLCASIIAKLKHLEELATTTNPPLEGIVEELAEMYWRNQDALQADPDAGHILRIVGDDYGTTMGLDFDAIFAIDETVQERVDREQAQVANWALYQRMQSARKEPPQTIPF